MKLLNVPPVKPGQKFRFEVGSRVYRVNSIKWCSIWHEWEVSVTVLVTPNPMYRVGESISFFIYSDDVVEILND